MNQLHLCTHIHRAAEKYTRLSSCSGNFKKAVFAHFADGETVDKVACLNWNSDARVQLLSLCFQPELSCLWALSGGNYSFVLAFLSLGRTKHLI